MSLLKNRVNIVNKIIKKTEVKLPAPKEREPEPKIKFNINKYNENLQIIRAIRKNRDRIKELRGEEKKPSFNEVTAEIKRIEQQTNEIRGYISWENNRSRQANTIIKRGF